MSNSQDNRLRCNSVITFTTLKDVFVSWRPVNPSIKQGFYFVVFMVKYRSTQNELLHVHPVGLEHEPESLMARCGDG